ncbi:2'-5' RNA ligase family protein [Paenibacillus sp. FSL K6-4396]|uniref:2'-5' RNA ligase family protein n=1 Tax=unclassified Paenibacillus TaxID=185978 RepID=UPI001781FA4E|nr:2'-5' RNA ligase family protein [Paenibacillus sp. CFBP 13594]MBD8836951.1 2'-5' RNA ligase family protein [Paenibacillus sp. CFBP 13594]
MKYFIGIRVPDDYKEKVVTFRDRWSRNRLNDVVEPHITVKAQSGLTVDLQWLENVRQACSLIQSFQLSLSEPGSFGSAVTFLSVSTSNVIDLHRRLVNVFSLSQELLDQYFEMDKYHPHLTLGQTYWGLNETEIDEMKLLAMNELAPYPTFNVNFVRVYKEVEPNKYVPFVDIQLGTQKLSDSTNGKR